MTQALINNLEVLQNNSDITKGKIKNFLPSGAEKEKCMDFQNVYDKKINKSYMNNTTKSASEIKTSNTLGDLKNKITEITSSDDLTNFKKIIEQAAGEANLEEALDLTLEKDISNIIDQFKEILAPSVDTTVEDLQEDTEELVIPGEDAITTENVQIVASQIGEEIVKNPESELISIANIQIENDVAIVEDCNNTESMFQDEVLDIFDESTEIQSKTLLNDVSKKVDSNEEQNPKLEENIVKELKIKSIKAETGSSDNQESLMQNQTPEEHAVKVILNQDSVSFDKTFDIQNVQEVSKPTEVTPGKIIEQITKHLEGLQNNSRVSIILNPESLGKINIQLVKTAEGLMAQFTVDSAEAKEILMKGLDGLKETLLSQGIGVDNVSVKLSDTQKSSYNPDWAEQEDSEQNNKEQQKKNKHRDTQEQFEQLMAQNEFNENGEV